MEWIDVNNNLPEDEQLVMVWKINPENPHWDTYGYGSYQNDKWYLDGGTNDFPIVTHWALLLDPPKTK